MKKKLCKLVFLHPHLPCLLKQYLAGSKIWLELIQKDFSNEIRMGYYCFNHINSTRASLYAVQKCKPSIGPLAVPHWREWWQLTQNEYENKYTWRAGKWILRSSGVCLDSWQSSRNTISIWKKSSISHPLKYNFSSPFTGGRPEPGRAVCIFTCVSSLVYFPHSFACNVLLLCVWHFARSYGTKRCET